MCRMNRNYLGQERRKEDYWEKEEWRQGLEGWKEYGTKD